MQRHLKSEAAAAAVLALSTVTAGAAYLKWSKGLEKDLAVTKEQKEQAESTGLAGFPNLSAEDKGITITAQQSIIDNYYGYLAFKVEFSDLGVIREKAGMAEDVVKGKWAFQWKLNGSDEIHTAKVNEKLGDSGATVTGAEVSPISIKAVYDFPARTVKEKAVDGDTGTEYETELLAEPPLLVGVKLMDGTLVMGTQGGVLGYTDGGKRNYEERFGMGRILDVDKVESLLFVKKPLEEERKLTEDDLYVVNIR